MREDRRQGEPVGKRSRKKGSKPQAPSPRLSLTSPLEKATLLLRKAVSTSSEEEARTSALIAARLISKHELVLAEKTGSRLWARDEGWRPAPPTVVYVEKKDPPPPGSWVEASGPSFCYACHGKISRGDRVWAIGFENLCVGCRELL